MCEGGPRIAKPMTVDASHHDPAVLLRAEHAVARVLTDALRRGDRVPAPARRRRRGAGMGRRRVVADRRRRRGVAALRRDVARARALRADDPQHRPGGRRGPPRPRVASGRPACIDDLARRPATSRAARAPSARACMRVLLPDPRRGRRARRDRVPRRRAAPARRERCSRRWRAWGAASARRRALARGGPPARQRRAQDARSSTPPSTASSRWTPTAASSRSTGRPSGRSATRRARWSAASSPS